MNIQLQISETDYKIITSRTCRSKGSIEIINEREGNFSLWSMEKAKPERPKMKCPLRSGEAKVYDNRISVNLDIEIDGVEQPLEKLAQDLNDIKNFLDRSFYRDKRDVVRDVY